MVKRYLYSMDSYAHVALKMGRLQTLKTLHCVAGETWSFQVSGITRQSPLARDITVDGVNDYFAFYMPYRHAYSNWSDFIEEGVDEDETFTGVSIGTNELSYLGFPEGTFTDSGTIPTRYLAMYNRIWNWYFRVRSDTSGELSDTAFNTSANGKDYGNLCSRLPSQWSETMNPSNLPADSTKQVDASGNEVSIIDFAKTQGEYESRILRSWFGNTYKDIIDSQFSGNVSTDADERPTLMMHKRDFMSGRDVDGTDEVTLGSFSGKSVSPVDFYVPPFFCPEHGMIMLMQLARFPTIHENEHHYLAPVVNPTYEEIAGDPQIIENSEPVTLEAGSIFGKDTSTTDLGTVPHSWYYRSEPSYIHKDFDDAEGFPFLTDQIANQNDGWYHEGNDYDSMFQTRQFGHQRTHVRIGAQKKSPVPPAIRSIYAGV
ncbi:putative major capsid protein [Eel River basin pequenovirus]|nr:putative major capsid protein [Eel River basin pequenovirus]